MKPMRSLAEINPLAVTADGRVVAIDAKMNFDDNALFRHPDIVAMRDLDEEDEAEVEASKFGLSYISLDGDIGCLVNGAGLAMATMDIIKLYGASPANFLDVGGGATAEKVTEAFKLMLKNPKVRAILINIFGGIMKCDVIAEGVVAAARQVQLSVPLVVRLEGTNVDLGKKILAESGLPIISAANMADAAQKAVTAAKAPLGGKCRSSSTRTPESSRRVLPARLDNSILTLALPTPADGVASWPALRQAKADNTSKRYRSSIPLRRPRRLPGPRPL